MTLTHIFRWAFAAIGAALAVLEPTLPYLLICTMMIFADCYTAWSLARRVAKAHPEKSPKTDINFRATTSATYCSR